MFSIDLSGFPPDEIATFRKLCAEYRFSPAQFFIYATMPKLNAASLSFSARIVYVEFLPAKKEKAYRAAPKQDWLAAFTQDLRNGFYADRK